MSKFWVNRFARRASIGIAIGLTTLYRVVVGGDYLFYRFGRDFADSAFTDINAKAQKKITQLEGSVPGVISNQIVPKILCQLAEEHHISKKILKVENVNCPPIQQESLTKPNTK